MDDDDDFEDLLRDTEDDDVYLSSPEKTPILPPAVKDVLKPVSASMTTSTSKNELSTSAVSTTDPNLTTKEREKWMDIDLPTIPSENELRLAKRVAQLEKERNELAAELNTMKTRFPSYHPTIPVPGLSSDHAIPSATSSADEPVVIPPSLIPVLAVLRTHIAELTRDNRALRYTFLGPNPPSKGSIKPTQTPFVATPLNVPSSSVTVPAPPGGAHAAPQVSAVADSTKQQDVEMGSVQNPRESHAVTTTAQAQIDLSKVLDRVKDLIQENEELGEMVLEAGRNGQQSQQWEEALQDSRAVIASLDADLSHHLSVVQSVQTELASYRTHFGPLTSNPSNKSAAGPGSTSMRTLTSDFGSSPPRGIGIRGSASGSSTSRGPLGQTSIQGSGAGSGSGVIPSGPRSTHSQSQSRGNGHRLDRRANDRPRSDRDRERDDRDRSGARGHFGQLAGPRGGGAGRDGRGANGSATPPVPGSGLGGGAGHLTPTSTGGSAGSKGDERGYKRRR